MLWSNMKFDPSPNETTLKYVSSGKLCKNRINASFAFSILLPLIEPLLSNKKMYSPFAADMSVSSYFLAIDAFMASSRLSSQNFGMKLSMAVQLTSVLPKT